MRTASTSMTAVRSSSKVNLALPIIFRRQRLVERMSHSKIPPHQGAFGRLNVHCMPRPEACCWTSSLLTIDRRTLAADLNVFPLSETILVGNPLLATNFFRQRIKQEVETSRTRSRCTALVTQQVNKQIHTLGEVLAPFR